MSYELSLSSFIPFFLRMMNSGVQMIGLRHLIFGTPPPSRKCIG